MIVVTLKMIMSMSTMMTTHDQYDKDNDDEEMKLMMLGVVRVRVPVRICRSGASGRPSVPAPQPAGKATMIFIYLCTTVL
jgi:hypothetical protein